MTIPVIANGDIFSGADAAHILRYTGADLAMVGRGSFGDPWLFARGNAAIAGGIRYLLVVLFAGCVWPLTFWWFSRLGRR